MAGTLDKLFIFAVVAGPIKQLMLGLILLMALAGCATPTSNSSGDTESLHRSASYTEVETSERVSVLLELAEESSALGDQEGLLANLLEAARISGDAELARQAVATAWRLNLWEGLVEASLLWRQNEPGSEDARRLLALGLLNSGRTEEATSLLRDWLITNDERGPAWRELAQLLAAVSDSETAERVFDGLLSAEDLVESDVEVLRARSRLSWQLDRPQEALELALAAAESSGERDDLVWAAQLATALDDYAKALELYRQARALDPGDEVLGLSEAESLRRLDRLEEALEILEGLVPSFDVFYSIATYRHLLGEPEAAREAWEQAAAWTSIEDRDQHAFMVAWLAELLDLQSEAADWYSRVRGGPNADRALLRRAVLLAEADRLDEARQMLVLARDTEQRDSREQAWLIEAELLREAERSAEAVEILGVALRENPGSIPLLYSRAINAIELHDLELAEQDLRRIIQIDPDNSMALNALGYTLTDRTTRHAEAYRLIRRALELSPDEPAILDSMGWVYFRLGRPETALGYLERALDGEDNPEIAAHLGEVLWTLNKVDRAREILHDAWERHPDDRHLADTMERLELWP